MPKLYTIVDGLSPEGRKVLAQCAAEKRTAAFTVQAIADATGEAVKERTAARHLANLRGEGERRAAARDRMADLVGALRAGDASAADMIQALAMDALTNDPEALDGDPLKLQRMGLASEELRLKRRQLEVKERAVAVQEARLKLLEDREKRLVDAVADTDEAITPEQRYAKVREILGLRS